MAAGDAPGALELLRRLVSVVGGPFENLDSAAALLEKMGRPAEAIEFLEQLVTATPWEDPYRLRLERARIAAGRNPESARESLLKIASNLSSRYALRAEAASALARFQPVAGLGSEELKLLARDTKQISPVSADVPFFYDSRIRVAQSLRGPKAKLQLLQHAIADTPSRTEAGLPLFLAAANERRDELAEALFDSYLSHMIGTQESVAPNEGEEEILSAEEEDAEDNVIEPLSDIKARLTVAQQAQIAYTGSEVLMRLGRWNDALRYLESARKLEKSPRRLKEIAKKLADVRGRLRRQRENLTRQPVLHDALEQDRIVRPRILPRSAAPAAKKGA